MPLGILDNLPGQRVSPVSFFRGRGCTWSALLAKFKIEVQDRFYALSFRKLFVLYLIISNILLPQSLVAIMNCLL